MGAVASFVGDVVGAVGDVVESVGDVVEDAVDVVKDAGSWVDDNIIQPAMDDPLKTAVMVAATVYAGPAAATYFNTTAAAGAAIAAGTTSAATTLASGGDLDDALKAGVTSAAAAGVGYKAGAAVMGETAGALGESGSQVAAGTARGAASGVTRAALTGGDLETGLLVGGVYGGVGSSVNLAYNAATAELDKLVSPTVTPSGESFGDQPGDFPTEGNYGSPTAPGVMESTNRLLNYNARYAAPVDSEADKMIKREATKAIAGEILDTDSQPVRTMVQQPKPVDQITNESFDFNTMWDEMKKPTTSTAFKPTATDTIRTSEIVPKQYQDSTGNVITILHRGDEPLSPIPPGAVALAEGGLVDRKPSTMVKYSTKALAAPKKTVQKPKKTKIAGKGLASKKKS
jgi:hypothetical protein